MPLIKEAKEKKEEERRKRIEQQYRIQQQQQEARDRSVRANSGAAPRLTGDYNTDQANLNNWQQAQYERYQQQVQAAKQADARYAVQEGVNRVKDLIGDTMTGSFRGVADMLGGRHDYTEEDLTTQYKRYQRDLDLYGRAAQDARKYQSQDLYNRAQQGLTNRTNAYNDAYSRYTSAQQRAREAELQNLKQTNVSAYYGETMSAKSIEAKIAQLEREKGRAVMNADQATQMAGSDPDRAKVYSSLENDGKRPEYMNQLWNAKDRVDQLDAEITRYKAALRHRNSLDKAEEMRKIAEDITGSANFKTLSEVGRAMLENRNKQARASVNPAEYQPDDPDNNLQFAKAMRDEQNALRTAGYVEDLDSSYIPEDVKPIYYALYAQNPQKAKEWAEYWQGIGEDAYWRQIWEQSGRDAGTRLSAFIQGTFANTVAGLNPFGEGGQYAAKLGSTMIGGGAEGLTEKGLFNTGFGAGTYHSDLFGDISLGSAYQLGSSMLQSAANATLAKMTGGAAELVGGAGTILLGSSAAAQDYQEKLEQGWDEGSAKLHALLAGTAESVFEYVSLDKLVNQDVTRGFLKNFLVQGGVEASEEALTTIANRVTDGVISELSGNENQIRQKARELIEKGYEKGTAEKMAQQEWMTELMSDALGGFLSGGLMSSGQYAMQPVYRAMGAVDEFNRFTQALSSTGEEYVSSTKDLTRGRVGREAAELGATLNDETVEAARRITGQEGTDSSTPAEASAQNDNTERGTGNPSPPEQKLSKRQQRKQDSRAGAVYEQAVQTVEQKIDQRGVGSVNEIFNETVEQYGENAKSIAQEAITRAVSRQLSEAGSAAEIDRMTNTEGMAPEVQQAIKKAQDYHTYRVAVQTGDREAWERVMQRHAGNQTHGGALNMEVTVNREGTEQKASITGLSKDGKGVVLSDGSTVSAEEFASENIAADADTKDIVGYLLKSNMGPAAELAMRSYISEASAGLATDGYRYVMDAALAFNQGRRGDVSVQQAQGRSSLDKGTVARFYELGQETRKSDTEAQQAEVDELLKNAKKGATGRKGTVDMSAVTRQLSDSEQANLDVVTRLAEVLGVDVGVFVSKTDSQGRFIGENGRYQDGKIWIDLNAGRNSTGDIGSGILACMSHELTHFIQDYAPTAYAELKQFVMQELTKAKGSTWVDRQVQSKINRAKGQNLSVTEAEDELVADACQNILMDSKAIHDYAKRFPTSFAEVLEWLKNWFSKVKEALSSRPMSREAEVMSQLEEKVRKAFGELWDKGVMEATEVHERIGSKKNTAQEGEVKATGQNSDRDTEYLELAKDPEKNQARLQEMVDEKAKQAGYPLKLMHGTNSFGFTTVNFNESDDKVSFFATDNEEVAGSYVRPMDDYDDEPSTYVRPIGKPVKNRITQSSSVGDILAELKRLAPDSYRDTNAATKAQIQEKVDEQLSYVRDIARQLDRFSLPERLQTMAQKVMEAKSAQVAVELVESVDDIHEIISNGMYFEQAMGKLDNLRANTNTLKKWAALTPETVAIRTIGNRTSLVDKNHLYDAYLDHTGLSGRGIYEIYTTENNPLRINCRGNRWNNIPLSGEMAADLGERSTTREISKWAHDHGYGMVEFDNVKDTGKYGSQFTPASTVYAFLEGGGNNFKSADAVTYDDNGDVIPLSERFSDKNELRYSERDESVLTPEEARRLLDGRAQEDLDKLYAEFAEAINAPKSLDPKQIYNLYREDVENDKVSYGRGTAELKRGREIIRKITALETSLQQFMDDLQSVPVDEFTVRLTPPKEYGLFISESTNSLMFDSPKRIADEAEKLYQDFKSGNRRDEKRFREYVKKLYALSQKAGEPFYVYGVEYSPKGKPDTDTKYSDRENPKPRSAQAQRDAGYKLSESKFYSLYFAHKLDLRHRGDVLDQIENIKAEGFKGDGGFGNNVMPSRQIVTYPYREKYKVIKELEEKGGYGFEPGYADRWKAELGDEFDKPFPENLSVKAYGPRKGEYIMLVPKSGVEVRGSRYTSSERVRPGYKPGFDYEFVQCEYDFQPYYEMYSKAYDRVMAAQKVNVDIDTMSQSAAPSDTVQYSERTWTASRFVQDRENAAKALAKALDVTQKQAEKYIDDINSVAKAIADDRVRLDYMSSPGRSAFKSNAEYGGSIDFSTLCKKRQLLTGTFNAIQHALANTVLTAEDVLRIRQMMQDAGLEVNCGMCYVEGSRTRMGEYNKTFLELYRKYYPDNWQPKMEDVNTTDGLELMRMEHPEAYEQYEYFYNNHGTLRSEDKAIFSSQAKPKEYQLRTEYKGEIREKFKNESNVETKNRNGGLRMQSFSDFEIVHLIDCMQVIMDMSEVGLAGQAYTKVPEFAEALGRTGLKINLSLVAKGVDENGKLIFNDVEGMPHERAFGIREKYSENVGTILVVYDDAQLVAAMADDKVDFIIPFHRSQWRKSQYAAMGLPKTTKDYTYQQNEKWLNPKEHTHKYRDKIVPTKCTNYMPNEYWDFSLSGTENARRYLEMCAKDGKRPKFYKLLQNNGDGSFSLKADGSTDGYWKLLIDFKMYDNDGVGVPQMPVQPIFDMDNAMQMLDDYSGDPSRFPVAEGIVDQFVSQYKAEHPGVQYSIRDSSGEVYRGLLIDDSDYQYSAAILRGLKKGETRLTRDPFLDNAAKTGERIALIRSGVKGRFTAYATARIGEPEWIPASEWENRRNDTRVPKGSKYDIGNAEGKWYYPLLDVEKLQKEIKPTSHSPKYGRFDDARYSERDYDNTLSDYDLIMGSDGDGLVGDQKTQLKEVKQKISNVQKLRDKLAQTRADLRAAEKKIAELKKKDGTFKQAVRASKAEAALARERVNAKGWENVADRTAKQLDKTIKEKRKLERQLEQQIHREEDIINGRLKPLAMQRLLADERKNAREKANQHKDEVFANYRERKNRTEIRNRIKNLHAEMNRDLLRPREGHFVPEALIRPVVELLDMVNTQTGRARSENAQAKIDAINAQYDKLKNDERYSAYYDETVKALLVELSATLAGRSIYDLNSDELADVYTAMKAMRTTIRNAIKADLVEKGKESWEIGNELRQELRSSKGANAYLLEKYHMSMLNAQRAFNRFGGYRQDSTWNKVYRMLDNAQLDMLRIEMEATRLFDPVLKAKEDFEQAQALTSIKDKDLVDVGLKDADGKAVKITRGMMLGLWMHLQNEDNMRHLMYGGLTLPDFKRYYKGSSEAWGRGTVEIPALGARVSNLDQLLEQNGEEWVNEQYREQEQEIREMFESVRQNIENQLTDYDRKWIAASKDFFDNFSRRELNRVTNSMYGFSKAKVDNYFPIVTDSNFLKSEFDSISRNVSLENAGFMKERVRAANPILLEDITRTVNRQISNVSRYAGLTEALKQFGNIYNVQTKGFTDSVKKAMAKSYGRIGQEYVQNLITDMVGGRSTPGTIFDRIKGNYAQAVLSANLSVTIKQAASFPTAAATVGWKPLMKALAKGGRNSRAFSRADRALIDTYSPLLWKRAQGAIDTEIGDMAHAQDWTKKAKWLMGWIEKADIMTVGRLWYAAEYYVKDNFNLEKGSAEQIRNGESPFYQKVAEVFNRIVEETQPNYTVLQRPDILRNPNKLLRSLVMFSTQRFQNGQILMDAAAEYAAMRTQDRKGSTEETRAARQEARRKLTWAISSQVVAAVVLNAMTLFAGAVMHRMNPWRDDDDEITLESTAGALAWGWLESMAGSYLAGSEVFEAVQSLLTGSTYYGNDVGGISSINDFASAVINFGQKAAKLVGDENSKPEDWANLAKNQLWKVGEYLSQMTGVPVANIKKILEGGKAHVVDAINGNFGSFEASSDLFSLSPYPGRSGSVNARRYLKAFTVGDSAKMQAVLTEMQASGKSEDSVKSALSGAAKDAYNSSQLSLDRYAEFLLSTGYWDEEKAGNRIVEILKDEYEKGLRTEEDVTENLIRYKAKVEDENDAWKVIQRWETTQEHKDEEDYSYSEFENLNEDLSAGKSFSEAAAEYLEHGYKEENLRENAVKNAKKRYLAGDLTEGEAISLLLDYAWKKEDGKYRKLTSDEAWLKVQEWDESSEHTGEEDYNWSKYDSIDEALAGNKDIKTLVKELTDHGVKEKDINSHIKSQLIQSYADGKTTEAALKNQLSRYLGIVAKEDVDKILKDANSKKQFGVAYSILDEEYRAGNVSKQDLKNALMKYGGLSSDDADKKVRYYDLQKAKPDLDITEGACNSWYDGSSKSRENGHESAKAAGMSIEQYLQAKAVLDKISDANGNRTGEDEYIAALSKMNLTSRQKDALYYEKYKGTTKYSRKTW